MRYATFVVTFFYASALLAQEILPPINLRSHSIKEFDAKPIGDSVLITWISIQQPSGAELVYRFLIKPDKSINAIGGLPGSIDNIVKIEDTGDTLTFICASDERGATILREIAYDKERKSLAKPREIFRTKRKDIVKMVPTESLLVFSEDNELSTLIVTEIDKSRKVSEMKFVMPDKVLKLRDNALGTNLTLTAETFALFHESTIITPDKLGATLKFYLDGRDLTILRDRPNKTYGRYKGYTNLIKLDLDRQTIKSDFIGESDFNTFTSYFFDGHLFRIGMNRDANLQKHFALNIYKGDSLKNTIEFKQDLVYVRVGKYYKRTDFSIAEKFKCMDAFSAGELFVQPHLAQSGKVMLKIGSYEDTRPPTPLPLPVPASSTTIATPGNGKVTVSAGASTRFKPMINNLAETIGEARYFYMSGDIKNGFEYSQGKGSLDHEIDAFELNGEKDNGKYKMKKYLKTRNYTYAFYRQKGDKEIQVVRFQNTRLIVSPD
jgi:hypothetical protein